VKMWFLCYFYHRLLDYRRPEVAALAKLFGGDAELQWKLPLNHHEDSPFHFIWLPSEEIASKIANRSVLVKCMLELWGQGYSYEELKRSVQSFLKEQKLPYLGAESTFRILVDTFGKVLSFEEQKERIESFSYIPFEACG